MTAGELVLSWGAATHEGLRRRVNEDGFLAGDGVFLVADGMGGHDAGEVASALALEALSPLRDVTRVDPDVVVGLVTAAQARIRGIDTGPGGRAAGTTLTGAVVAYQDDVPYWLFVNVGDSRTYLLSGGTLDQVSVDHSEVQQLVDAGLLTEEEARRHPRRNVVTRALGADETPAPDFRYVPVVLDDRLLVCSDGLTVELTDERITQVLLDHADPQQAAARLVDEAIAAGGRDNITVVVVDVTGGNDADRTVTSPRGAWEPDEDTVPSGASAPGRDGSPRAQEDA
ncbi:protein phosphatase 2C domain-containing protein [Isoptericola halotolerans]|uniref:Protein phosphatase n=1 Tax=Isoptericola halotolerans TaxID=300560 RepID=A0ABX2A006_9MICO|nr:protein phosphatase 2C domain-containing protein [Isoptericola halotolerans]NOV96173.1 protein phosphatase [Isoptericola halotolerans]